MHSTAMHSSIVQTSMWYVFCMNIVQMFDQYLIEEHACHLNLKEIKVAHIKVVGVIPAS